MPIKINPGIRGEGSGIATRVNTVKCNIYAHIAVICNLYLRVADTIESVAPKKSARATAAAARRRKRKRAKRKAADADTDALSASDLDATSKHRRLFSRNSGDIAVADDDEESS